MDVAKSSFDTLKHEGGKNARFRLTGTASGQSSGPVGFPLGPNRGCQGSCRAQKKRSHGMSDDSVFFFIIFDYESQSSRFNHKFKQIPPICLRVLAGHDAGLTRFSSVPG